MPASVASSAASEALCECAAESKAFRTSGGWGSYKFQSRFVGRRRWFASRHLYGWFSPWGDIVWCHSVRGWQECDVRRRHVLSFPPFLHFSFFFSLAIQNQHATCRSAKNRFANLIIRNGAERNLIFHILSHWRWFGLVQFYPSMEAHRAKLVIVGWLDWVTWLIESAIHRSLWLCKITSNYRRRHVFEKKNVWECLVQRDQIIIVSSEGK